MAETFYKLPNFPTELIEELRAVFKNKEESVKFVNTWLDLYPKGDVTFWYENPD